MEEELQPTWLDERFVKQVLKSVEGVAEDQCITTSKWKCSHAVPPGTNYLSLLYRLWVEYTVDNQSRSITLIVKIPLESGQVKEFVEFVDGYGRELRMYQEVLPRMYEIVVNSESLSARSYDCPLHNSLVLEDLQELGYKMSNRLNQLDAAHCSLFLSRLAKFHGLSVALIQKEPQLIERVGKLTSFSGDHDEEKQRKTKQFVKFNMTAMMKTVESLGLARFSEIIRGKVDSFYETMERIFKPSGELRVLNHGDCWTTNVLFKYNDSDEVIDAKLIDFQMSEVGSYAQDLLHFWVTSARQDVRENLQDELFEVYRENLNQTLESIQMNHRVSKAKFDDEIRRFSPYALYVCSSLLTIAMADPEDLLNLNDVNFDEQIEFSSENLQATKNYRSKYYKTILPKLLSQLERLGGFA